MVYGMARTVFVLLCCANVAWAETQSVKESAEEPLEVKPVIVSATKTPQPLSEVTSAIEVITGEQMQQKNLKTVVEALRLSPGLAVFQSGGFGTEASVRIRGAQPRHTLVFIDGVIVNSPTAGAYDFANLTAENIDRIEILRGAQSMLYGSDAIGGVINIYTKRGAGSPTATAFMEYGSFATIREGANLSGAKGRFDFSGSLSRWDTSSFSAINYRRGASERDGFHNWQGSGKLGVTLPKDGRLEFNLRWYNSDVNIDGFDGNSRPADIFGARQSTRNLIASGSYFQPLTSWWSQRLTLARANEHLLATSGMVGRNLDTGQEILADPFCAGNTCFFPFQTDLEIINQRLEWQHNFQIAKPLLVTAGYQFREESGDAPGFFGGAQPSRRIASHAGYAQAQLNLWDRLMMTGGVRQDSYNVFGDATTYRVTGGYLIKETRTKFRTSYATGFRAPTLNDLFFQGFGNPNLRPEKSKSFDAGIDQSFFEGRLQLTGGYFWNHYHDLIQFATVPSILCPANTFGFCPINVAEARSQGWELGFKATLMKGLEAWGQYTYTLTRNFDTPASSLGSDKRLARWPIDQFSVGLSYQPIDPVRMTVDYRFVGARNNDLTNTVGQKQGSFGVVNASASYNVTKNMQIYGRVDNLLNQKYEEILFFGTPIRSVYGGVRLSL